MCSLRTTGFLKDSITSQYKNNLLELLGYARPSSFKEYSRVMACISKKFRLNSPILLRGTPTDRNDDMGHALYLNFNLLHFDLFELLEHLQS